MGDIVIRQDTGLRSNDSGDEFLKEYYKLTEYYDADELYDMVINHLRYTTNRQYVIDKALEIYEEVRKSADGMPAFVDITANIATYNEEIFYHIAVMNAYDNGTYVDIQNAENPDEMLEEAMVSIIEMFTYNMEYTTADDFLFQLLTDHKLCFTVSEDDSQYTQDVQADYIMNTLPESGK